MEIKALATVLVFVTVFENGATLYCRNCLSSKSFDECEKMGDIVQCNSTIVNQNHENFKNYNPGLEQGNWTDFKCYRIQVAVLFPNNTDSGNRGYSRGCTFNNTNFCSGWSSQLNVTSCGTCLTDNCDAYPIEPTQAPGQSTVSPIATTPQGTTSSNIPTQQSTVPGVATTTTKKPSSGVLLQASVATLASMGVLLIIASR